MEDLANVELPFEMLVEIARANWHTWGKFGACNRALNRALARDDPYAMFTVHTVIDPDLDEIWVGWRTCDGVVMRIVVESTCGFLIVKYRDGRALWYDYSVEFDHDVRVDGRPKVIGTKYTIDRYTNIMNVEDLKNVIFWGWMNKSSIEISEAEWRAVMHQYDLRSLVKAKVA